MRKPYSCWVILTTKFPFLTLVSPFVSQTKKSFLVIDIYCTIRHYINKYTVHICGIAGLSESRVFVQVLVTEHTLQHSTELQVLRIGRHCVGTVVSHVNVSGHLIKANQIIAGSQIVVFLSFYYILSKTMHWIHFRWSTLFSLFNILK